MKMQGGDRPSRKKGLKSSAHKQKGRTIGNSTLLVALVFPHIQRGEKAMQTSSAQQRKRKEEYVHPSIPPPTCTALCTSEPPLRGEVEG